MTASQLPAAGCAKHGLNVGPCPLQEFQDAEERREELKQRMAVTASQLLADPERHLPSIKLLLELARDRDAQVGLQVGVCDVGMQKRNQHLAEARHGQECLVAARLLTTADACSCTSAASSSAVPADHVLVHVLQPVVSAAAAAGAAF